MTSSDRPIPLPERLELAPRESSLAAITSRLLDYLLSGEIEWGAKIPPEREIVDALGIGRSAVREALTSLSLLGVLDVRQGDGTYLSRSGSDLLPRVIEWSLLLDEPEIGDLVELRAEIEMVAAGLAALRAEPKDIEAIRARLEAMRSAGNDIEAYIETDVAFHLEVARASGNEVMANLIVNLKSLLRVWAERVLRHAGETGTSLAMHEAIVDAIADGDPARAEAAMAAHMERANRRLHEALEADPAMELLR